MNGSPHKGRARTLESECSAAICGSATLTVNGTTRRFDYVVIATGARSAEFARQCGDKVPLDTERGYHVRYPDASHLISRPVGWAERGFYMTPMTNGLRVAGTVELGGFSETQNRSLLDLLTFSSKRALPALGMPDSNWLGFRPSLPDGVPVSAVPVQASGSFMRLAISIWD